MSHLGDGEYRGEVANLSRNVVVESADPDGVRGHTMYHKHSAGSLSYAEFRHLGKKDVLGRYAIHFHLCRDTMRGSVGRRLLDLGQPQPLADRSTAPTTSWCATTSATRASATASSSRTAPRSTTCSTATSRSARSAASGCRSRCSPFDGNEGAGFWWTCSLNSVHPQRRRRVRQLRLPLRGDADAARMKLDVPDPPARRHRARTSTSRTLPFVRFEDNEVHSSHGLYGVNLGEGRQPRRPGREAPVRRAEPEDLGRPLRLPPAGAEPARREPAHPQGRPTACTTRTTTTTSTRTCSSARRTRSRSTAGTTT